MYIYDNVVILSSMWYVLRFEHAHGFKRSAISSLGLFYFISLLQFLLPFSQKRLLTLLRESGRHSKSSVKAVTIFLLLAIKSTLRLTLTTVPCNENVPRLLLQQLRCYLSPLDVW